MKQLDGRIAVGAGGSRGVVAVLTDTAYRGASAFGLSGHGLTALDAAGAAIG